jgi:SAM-dependent methyltransferase
VESGFLTQGMVFSNPGDCPVCGRGTDFTASNEWFRDSYVCARCGSAPRQRAVVGVLDVVEPQWRERTIHESSPCIDVFARQCRAYSSSYYFEDISTGSARDGRRCENLELLMFSDSVFDIFITQDVLEHVFRPDLAVREVARVLKPGGIHVFTTPKHKHLLKSRSRARQTASGDVEYLLPAEYHGNPIGDGRSLVTWDYGADFEDLVAEWSGYLVSTYAIRDRARGLDGEYLKVFVMRKDAVNRVPRLAGKRPDAPVWNLELVGMESRAWERKAFQLGSQQELVISGWAVDHASRRPAGGVVMVISDVRYEAELGGHRPDVAQQFGTPEYSRSGYALKLPAGHLPAGSHDLYVRVLASDRQSYWEAGPYTLSVR